MKNNKIIVATITWDGGDSKEGGKIIKTMRELGKHNYNIVTVDGGSSKETIEGMKKKRRKNLQAERKRNRKRNERVYKARV